MVSLPEKHPISASAPYYYGSTTAKDILYDDMFVMEFIGRNVVVNLSYQQPEPKSTLEIEDDLGTSIYAAAPSKEELEIKLFRMCDTDGKPITLQPALQNYFVEAASQRVFDNVMLLLTDKRVDISKLR